MRLFVSVFLSLFLASRGLSAQVSGTMNRAEYIEKYKEIAIKQMKSHAIPASITLAQGCLESGNGNSTLARKGNNHFGIKCHNWDGKSIFQTEDNQNVCYRKYDRAEDSYKDHSDFLRFNKRYAFLFDLEPTDYKGWAYGLKKAGYATDEKYPQKLIRIIEEEQLYQYDKTTKPLPPTPTVVQTPARIIPTKGSPLYQISLYREVLEHNKTAYIIANEYDTYSSLAREYNLFTKELLRFNDLKEDQKIMAGTIVYLEKKRKQAAKYLDKHVVEEGETLYFLSQKYGVRLKYLLKYNNMAQEMALDPGTIIKLRKK